MDSSWRRSIDETLNSTRATLRRLQERHAHYDVAKQRVEEAFGFSPSSATGGSMLGVDHSGYGRSPVAAQVRRRTDSSAGGSGAPLPAPLPPCSVSGFANSSTTSGAGVGKATPATAEAPPHRLEELTAAVRRLGDENATLRQSVRALEAQVATSSKTAAAASMNGGASSILGGPGSAHGNGSPLEAARSAFLHSHSADEGRLRQRVAELEANVERQQRLLASRDGRADRLLRELVEATVSAEMTRARSVAREAAREAAEDLLRVRLGTIQSVFREELHTTLGRAGIRDEVVAEVAKQLRERDEARAPQREELRASVAALQRAAAAGETGARLGERLADLERQHAEDVARLEASLADGQREEKEGLLRLAQSTAAKVESARVELLAAVPRVVDEVAQHKALREGGAPLREVEVRRLLESAVQPLESRVETVAAAAARAADGVADVRRLCVQSTEDAAAVQARHAESIEAVRQALEQRGAVLDRLRTDVAAAQAQLRTTTHTAEEAAQAATEAVALARRVGERCEDELRKCEAKVSAGTHTQEAAQVRLGRVSGELDTLTSRVGELQAAVQAVELGIARSVHPLTARMESLQTTVAQTCLPGLERVEAGLTEAAARVQQLQDSRASRDRQLAQRLSEVGAEVEARLRGELEALEERSRARGAEADRRVAAQTTALAVHEAGLADVVRAVGELRAASEARPATAAAAHAHAMSHTTAVAAADEPHEPTLRAARGLVEEVRGGLLQRLTTTDRQLHELVEERVSGLAEVHEANAKHHADRVQQRLADAAAQVRRTEVALDEHVEALQRRVDEVAGQVGAQVRASEARLRDALAAPRLAQSLVADELALEQVAAALRGAAGADDAAANAMEQVRASVRGLERRCDALDARAAASQSEVSGPGSVSGTRAVEHSSADASTRLPPVEAAAAGLAARVAAVETAAADAVQQLRRQVREGQEATLASCARLEDLVPSLQLRLTAVEAQARELAAAHAGTPSLVQARLQSALDTQREEMEAALQPMDARTRRVEAQCARLQAAQEAAAAEVAELHARDVADARRELDRVQADLAGLRSQVSTREEVLLAEWLRPTREALAELRRRVEETCAGAGPAAVDGSDGGSEAVQDRIAELAERLDALEEMAAAVEGREEAGLEATEAALMSLRDGLRECVDRARCVVEREPAMWFAAQPAGEEDGTAAAVAPPLESLEDVLSLLLDRVSSTHAALGTLQQNAVATLELIQQQELDVLAIPPLQQAVMQIASNLRPLAVAAGVDPDVFAVDINYLVGPTMASVDGGGGGE